MEEDMNNVLSLEFNKNVNKALVVDDDPFFRKLVSFPLEMQGFKVEMAANGAEALSMLKNNSYSVLVLDWIMPVLNGFDTLRRLDEIGALNNHLPIVIMTGNKADSIQMPHSDKFYLIDFWSKTEANSKWTKRAPFIGTKLKAS